MHQNGNEMWKEKTHRSALHRPNPNQPVKTSRGTVDNGVWVWMAKVSVFILHNTAKSWELALGKAPVSHGKLLGWVNSHPRSTRLRNGGVRATTPLQIARAYNSGRKRGFGATAWLYIKGCGSNSGSKVPARGGPQLRGGRRARDVFGPGLGTRRLESKRELGQVPQSGWDKDHI